MSVLRGPVLVLVLVALVALAPACSSPASPSELNGGVVATFEVGSERFKVFVKNPAAIQRLLQLQNGAGGGQIPNGRILRGSGTAGHNLPHAWHLDPDDIQIVDVAIELCDGRPSYVDANVDEYVDVVGRYCPWGARFIALTR